MAGATRPILSASLGVLDQEYRVARSDFEQLGVGGVRGNPVEEHPDLHLPAPEVRPQDVGLLLIGQLGRGEALDLLANPEFSASRCAKVAYPLGLATRGDQV